MLPKLNFQPYKFRFKNSENKTLIFDSLRKKFIQLTPEEWVRQNCVQFLQQEKNIPQTLMNVEKQIYIHNISKRYDIVTFKPDGSIFLIVECKAPSVKIAQETFDQIARYNLALNADYLMVTNGLNHYFCQMDYKNKQYIFLRDLPVYGK